MRAALAPPELLSYLLFIMLDDVGIAYLCLIRIEMGRTQRAALAQQIPALIQIDLKLAHAPVSLLVESSLLCLLCEFVLLVDQFRNALHDFVIVHLALLVDTLQGLLDRGRGRIMPAAMTGNKLVCLNWSPRLGIVFIGRGSAVQNGINHTPGRF